MIKPFYSISGEILLLVFWIYMFSREYYPGGLENGSSTILQWNETFAWHIPKIVIVHSSAAANQGGQDRF